MPGPIARPGKLTTRGRALAALGLFLLALSPAAGPGAVAAGAALVAVTLTLYLYAGVKAAALESLRVKRVFQAPLIEGRPLRVRVVVENPSLVPLEAVEVSDSLPETWRAHGAAALVSVPPGGRAWFEYEVVPTPGKYEVGPLTLSYRDPLGVAEHRASTASEVVAVLPRLLDLPKRAPGPAVQSPAGIVRSKRRGIGLLFLDLREYRPGDDIRFIDWRSTARTGRLMVKEFEHESVARVAVVLALYPSMYRGVVGRTKYEYSLRIAATLAEHLARYNHVFLVGVVQGGGVRMTPWLRGRGSAARARRFLAESVTWNPSVRGHPALDPERLVNVLVPRLGRSKTLVALITDFDEEPVLARKYAAPLRKLVQNGHEVVAIIPETTRFELEELGDAAPLYMVLAHERSQRYREIRRALASSGIRSVAAGPRDLLSTLLARLEVVST